MIRIRDLHKSYRRGDERVAACAIASLDIAGGAQVALMGASGSGKSTLLHLLSGLLLPDRGVIEVDGVDLCKLSERQRDRFRAGHIGYVFQSFHLLHGFDALENVRLGAFFAGRGHDRERAAELLRRVGLGERLHHRPDQLSVGQQQRVAVARALVNEPALLLADEPLGNQDRETGGRVLDLMLEMAGEIGSTVVMVTHDPDSARHMQRVLRLEDLAEGAAEVAAAGAGAEARP
ncbi:MAG: ABC transporter ATP-binding protein [Planctomycetota bacterium]